MTFRLFVLTLLIVAFVYFAFIVPGMEGTGPVVPRTEK
jgi:hypothetical protein